MTITIEIDHPLTWCDKEAVSKINLSIQVYLLTVLR